VDLEKVQLKRPYEAVVLIHPDATLEDQKTVLNKNKATIESFSGSVFSLETWGKRNLANPIGKIRKAYFFHTFFESDPQAIAELERTMRISEKVLRFMHTKLDERVPLSKHQEIFKKGLSESAQREKEREAKMQARRAAFAAAKSERFD
jgi:small subunit ribosomal protein S6